MGLYNFQPRFVPFVEDGTKPHTIRAERRHLDRAGDICHLYTGLRTKSARLIFRAPCVGVEEIAISGAQLWIAGEELSSAEKDTLAWNDGFRHADAPSSFKGCFDLMRQFWSEKHGSNIHFKGHITHWDYSRRSK